MILPEIRVGNFQVFDLPSQLFLRRAGASCAKI
jgi:hypothetical protein